MSALDSVKDLTAKAKTVVTEKAAVAKTVVTGQKPKFDAAVDKAATFVDTKTKGKFAPQVGKVQEAAKKIVPSA